MSPLRRLLKWWRERNYMRSRWEDQAEHWQGDDMPPLQFDDKARRERALPTWKRLGFESAEAWRRSFFEGLDRLDASGDAQVPAPPAYWTVGEASQAGRKLPGDVFWLVLMVLMLLIGFALGASFIAALRDGTASLITTFWGTK